MKKIGFVGAYDKTDLLIYVAKILELSGKKVCIIDTSNNQKSKYIIPVLSPSKSYIVNYKGIDVAIGLNSFEEINRYLDLPETAVPQYDYALIDIDKPEMMKSFNMAVNDKCFFVTSMDKFSLVRGLEALSGLTDTSNLTKVFFTRGMPKEEDDYLNFLSFGQKVIWNENRIYFPFDVQDQLTIMENQRFSEITIRNLSSQYKDSIIAIIDEFGDEELRKESRRVIKQLEKGI